MSKAVSADEMQNERNDDPQQQLDEVVPSFAESIQDKIPDLDTFNSLIRKLHISSLKTARNFAFWLYGELPQLDRMDIPLPPISDDTEWAEWRAYFDECNTKEKLGEMSFPSPKFFGSRFDLEVTNPATQSKLFKDEFMGYALEILGPFDTSSGLKRVNELMEAEIQKAVNEASLPSKNSV